MTPKTLNQSRTLLVDSTPEAYLSLRQPKGRNERHTSSFAKRGTIDGINRYKHKKRGNQQKQKVKVTNKRAAERQLRILNLHLKQWGEETEWGCCCHVKLASWGFLYRFPRTALSIHSATYSTLEEFNPAIEIRPLPVM